VGDQSNIVPQTKLTPETLKLVLPSDEEGGEHHYAVIAFPKTYKDAIESAVRVLGPYMTDARPENVILRCSIKSRKDVWVWADISPSDWTVTLRHNDKEVGVFERQNNSNLFIHGHVYLTRGTQNGCKTEWSSIVRESKGIGPRPLIDRPQTYGDAVKLVTRQASDTNLFHMRDEANALGSKTFTFYVFPKDNLSSWIRIPPTANTDDDLWRLLVPSTYGILGFMLT
jgi:hypothetical protein